MNSQASTSWEPGALIGALRYETTHPGFDVGGIMKVLIVCEDIDILYNNVDDGRVL